jgi:hypothetical protein
MTKVYRHDRTQIALAAMPGTLKDMADRIGTPKGTVQHWIKELRACGWAHVGGWKRSDGPGGLQPIFHAGQGRDALCKLKPLTTAEVCERYRKRTAEDGRRDVRLAKNRTRKHLKKLLAKAKGRTPTPFDALMM